MRLGLAKAPVRIGEIIQFQVGERSAGADGSDATQAVSVHPGAVFRKSPELPGFAARSTPTSPWTSSRQLIEDCLLNSSEIVKEVSLSDSDSMLITPVE
jgi:hypothetical protein